MESSYDNSDRIFEISLSSERPVRDLMEMANQFIESRDIGGLYDIDVTLTIYNLLGDKIRSLINTHQKAGDYSVIWSGKNDPGESVPSGIYFYKITAGNQNIINKLLYIK